VARQFLTNADHLDNSSPPFTVTPMTFAAWIKVDATGLNNQCSIMTIGSSGVSTQRWSIQLTATTAVGAQAFDTTSNSVNSTVLITENVQWHLAVCTYASDNITKTSTTDNNATISGGASRTPVPVTPVVRIGCNPNGAANYIGLVAHVAMWDVVLNAAEIAMLYTMPPSYVNTPHLREYWPLNGSSPEPSFGLSGNSLTVTGTTYSSDDPFGYPVTLMGTGYV
jgi:hypothetical protein